MKNRKMQFIRVVRLLAPQDNLAMQIARRVRENDLPAYPGGAALEFVVALSRLRSSLNCPCRFPGATRNHRR